MGRIEQYLDHYAEPHSNRSLNGSWTHGLVIPACNEGDAFIQHLQHLDDTTEANNLLVIVVINGRENADETVHQQNLRCARALKKVFQHNDQGPLLRGKRIDLLIVDRYSKTKRLRNKQGVGLARKIGCDILVSLHHTGQFLGSWMGSTDADAKLPSTYFSTMDAQTKVTAITYPFEHEASPGYESAMALYELSLHHYVLGLHWADSPYAYHTIGSCIAVSIPAYVSGRGFPKRLAGEDFYLLNKVAKLGPVYRATGDPIRLAGRPSQRVPFGTGPAIRAIRDQSAPYTLYDPQLFVALRQVLEAVRSDAALPYREVLETLGYAAIEQHVARQPPNRRLQATQEWFDGFRTLKFLHHLRDKQSPNRPWRQALGESPWWHGRVPEDPTEALRLLRRDHYTQICGSTPRSMSS